MKIKKIAVLLVITFTTLLMASCGKDDSNGITYELTKYEFTDGSGNEHENTAKLKLLLHNGCEALTGANYEPEYAHTYLESMIETYTVYYKPYSYNITITYSGSQSGSFNFSDTSLK